MLTRSQAKNIRNARIISLDSSPSSALRLPEAALVLTTTEASSSTSSDEYFSPPTSPTPVLRQGRGQPSICLGPRGPLALNRVPATGGSVRRMRWTTSMNENVMRAYFLATEAGTNFTAYRDRLLPLFQELEPVINVTAQRLSDQVRAIQRCHLLDDEVLERLRSDVRSSLVIPSSQNISDQIHEKVSHHTFVNEVVDGEAIAVSTQYNNELGSALERAVREYRFIPSECRPRLPRLPMHKRNMALVSTLDSMLLHYFENSDDLSDAHSILYCAAFAVCQVAGVKFSSNEQTIQQTNRNRSTVPAWQYRIERRIAETRVLIGKLCSFKSGNTRPRVMRFVRQAFLGTDIRPQEYMLFVTERIDYFTQKLYAWANRVRRYKVRVNRYSLNRSFQRNERCVYRMWDQTDIDESDVCRPNAETTHAFWRSIWSTPVDHTEGDWMRDVKQACELIPTMEPVTITENDVASAVRTLSNWKSAGHDGLHNFWLKWFRSSHVCLASLFQSSLESGLIPDFMTTGVTHLLYKSGSVTDPKNYRPITCLPTIYKLFTSILRAKVSTHIENNSIMSVSQNGCRRGARGTKELLILDMAISQQVRRNRRSLTTCWIDYKKAYDCVPHTWLLKVLDLYKIDTTVCTFLKACMRQWSTVLVYPGCRLALGNVEPIKIERGIFQGDSLSPLWFCLALNPLSIILKSSGLGYQLRRGGQAISHLLYMDDLKLFTSTHLQLIQLLKITENFSNCIGMDFGIDKCAIMHVKKGRVVASERTEPPNCAQIRSLCSTDTYKYLGMSQALGIADTDMKQMLIGRFIGRLKKVLKSLLSGGNKIRAFNSWVMPVLVYSFGILKWTQSELDSLDRKVRVMLTTYRMHHPRSSVMRLYIPRKCGGRGLLNAKSLHNREVCNLRDYFLHVNVDMHRDVVMVDRGLTPLYLARENWRKPTILSTADRKEIWKNKELHGRFYQALHGPDIDLKASVSWLRFGDLFGETEGFICAITDEVVKTNNYRKYILKDGTADICRACHRPGESLRHIISGCSSLANGEYLHRHNLVARIIHQQLALRYNLVGLEMPYYRYVPDPVLDNGRVTLYWDRSIITDRTIVANKPDIVVIDRLKRLAMIVDITIPHDDNLVKAEKNKQLKYLDLAHEIVDMWDVDSAIIVPIVISAHGLIAKSLDQHLTRLALDGWLKRLMQKAVLLDTARIVRRFLSLDP